MQFFAFHLLILIVYWDRFFMVQSQKANDDFQTEDLRKNLSVQNKHILLKKSNFFIWPYVIHSGVLQGIFVGEGSSIEDDDNDEDFTVLLVSFK
ncbi:hypothetical protein T02_4860 [Trichinella nativa]|uniref:Uncharacterized protein n=1 Tax=Trichinella nativa TaxID=6335 RepID=A0A0V1KVC8_9BILA|nr:hypothetical protein T02_4860 [Trichinella nativa]